MKFIVNIEETLSQNFVVEADSEEEAICMARDNYQNGLFVLETGEVQALEFSILNSE